MRINLFDDGRIGGELVRCDTDDGAIFVVDAV